MAISTAPAVTSLRRDDDETTDHDLVARVRVGDDLAFERLYRRYHRRIAAYVQGMVHDHARAEDVTQDVFLRVWRRPDQFDLSRGKFVTWLLSVARNRSIDQRRSQSRRLRHEALPATEEDEDVLPSDNARDDPALATVLAEERAAVRAALATLPPEQRLAGVEDEVRRVDGIESTAGTSVGFEEIGERRFKAQSRGAARGPGL